MKLEHCKDMYFFNSVQAFGKKNSKKMRFFHFTPEKSLYKAISMALES